MVVETSAKDESPLTILCSKMPVPPFYVVGRFGTASRVLHLCVDFRFPRGSRGNLRGDRNVCDLASLRHSEIDGYVGVDQHSPRTSGWGSSIRYWTRVIDPDISRGCTREPAKLTKVPVLEPTGLIV